MDNNNLPYRQTKRTVILGAPGTGKTTLLHRVLAQAGQKTLVITPYMNEWCERDANGVELYPELVDLKPTNLYFTGIRNGRLGRACAMSIVLFFIMLGLAYLQLATTRSAEDVEY